MAQFSDQVRSRNILFISCISRVLRNLLKYFNGTTISTFATPFLLVLFVSLDLNINELVSLMLLFGLSLQYYHKLADAFE